MKVVIRDWGLGIRADVESVIPIPNPQFPIPTITVFFKQNVSARLQFEYVRYVGPKRGRHSRPYSRQSRDMNSCTMYQSNRATAANSASEAATCCPMR